MRGSPEGFPHTLTELRRGSVRLPSLIVRVRTADAQEIDAPLGMTPLIVGTSPDCDLTVPDPKVSRRHCELTLREDGVVLRDLASKNGTLLGDVPLIEARLSPGVDVRIGNSTLSVHVVGAPRTLPLATTSHFGEAAGSSVIMRALFARLERAAATSETILLVGESGTGKELIARAIHDTSPRSEGPFVVFDSGAVAGNLVESELFGHVQGAFTGAVSARQGVFEQAHGGTLFIDEIGELPLDLQPKLLRALEARRIKRLGSSDWRDFDVRLVAATHRDLRACIASGTFREDLYYRLAVLEARVAPLRERKDDIPLLVDLFLKTHARQDSPAELPPSTMALLQAHDWPGNVRELRNTVARLVLFPDSPEQAITMTESSPEGGVTGLLRLSLREAREQVVEQFEREYLRRMLQKHGGNVSRSADAMGVSRQFVHRLLERYGLRAERYHRDGTSRSNE